eukprot:3516148-Amphidinium_carterae.1
MSWCSCSSGAADRIQLSSTDIPAFYCPPEVLAASGGGNSRTGNFYSGGDAFSGYVEVRCGPACPPRLCIR